MFSFFGRTKSKAAEPISAGFVVVENEEIKDSDFCLVGDNKPPVATLCDNQNETIIVDDYKKEAPPILNASMLREDYENYEKEVVFIPVVTTAYSQPLDQLSFDASKALGTSSHSVFMGKEIATGDVYFIKYVQREMAYVEAFMGHLYELSLLYGVGRAYVRYDATPDPKMSSKGLKYFKTFKEGHITQALLDNPEFCTRFTRVLSVSGRMMEDDFHTGNLTMPDPERNSPGLQIFDADCAYWPASYRMKGPRPGVDFVVFPGPNRDPAACFNNSEKDFAHFPNYVHANPWYFPSRTNPVTQLVSDNPWPAEDTVVVQQLEKPPETSQINFEENIDWMLDLSLRFPHVAALNMPHDLTVPKTEEKAIDLYCQVNKQADDNCWIILPKMHAFQNFIEEHAETVLRHILIRTILRNTRFMHEKEEAMKNPYKKAFYEQFDDALLSANDVVCRFNKLIRKVNAAKVVACGESIMAASVLPEFKSAIPEIQSEQAAALIKEAGLIAGEMFELEMEVGKEDWREFEKFDYKLKPPAQDPVCSMRRN